MTIDQRDPVIDRLRECGLRLTPQRLELVRILRDKGRDHPSFTQLCEAVWKNHPTVSQSTILKNMAVFEEIGMVRSFSYRGETHYELNPRPHVNLVDEQGKIVDLEDGKIDAILGKLVEAITEKTGLNASRILVMIERTEKPR